MKLPNAANAIVAREKIVDYLLNMAHPDNGGKAHFFEGMGFRRGEWQELARAFQALAINAEVTQSVGSPHGRKYVIAGRIRSPSGKPARVKTVWVINNGAVTARLVTAYPQEE